MWRLETSPSPVERTVAVVSTADVVRTARNAANVETGVAETALARKELLSLLSNNSNRNNE